ncbi:hypothetical protein KA107_01930 [Candidatus Pacearchaeota archaeon]|nr:hypothetical protein [Candidatus Pacearchaeota archaeon]
MSKLRLKTAATVGALVGAMAWSCFKDYQVQGPTATADVTGDGIQDVVVLGDYVSNPDRFQTLAYHDGRYLMKDFEGNLARDFQGKYHARGGAIPIVGTLVKRPNSSTTGRAIQVGNFGGDSNRLDVVVSDATPDFPIFHEQKLLDVF